MCRMTYKKLLLVSVLSLGLTACGGSIDRHELRGIVPSLTFAQLEPLPIMVETIDTNIDVKPYDHNAPMAHTPIDRAFASYVAQRFVKTGGAGTGTLKITLVDHQLVKTIMNTDAKLTSWTKLDQLTEYKASMRVNLSYNDGRGETFKTLTLSQQAEIQIPQRVSLAEREEMEQAFIEKLIAELDKQIVNELNTRLLIL